LLQLLLPWRHVLLRWLLLCVLLLLLHPARHLFLLFSPRLLPVSGGMRRGESVYAREGDIE